MHHFGEIKQLAYLTDDIETSMMAWMAHAGVGPFTWYKNLTLPFHYLDEERPVLVDVGIAFRGDMQIELIQQKDDAISPYKAFYDKKQMGFHHFAFLTQDIDASLQQAKQQGMQIISTLDGMTGRYSYIQSPDMPEVLYELFEIPESLEQFWQDSIDAAKQWDGTTKLEAIDMSGV